MIPKNNGKYPEHEKAKKIRDKSQTIAGFLYWLKEVAQIELCMYDTLMREYMPVNKSVQHWLAEYFHIDLRKMVEEDDAFLKEFQERQQTGEKHEPANAVDE